MVMMYIDNDDFHSMLMSRVKFWTDDKVKLELFDKYYSKKLDRGYYDLFVVDSLEGIVDNDVVNNCIVVDKDSLAIEKDADIVAKTDNGEYYLIEY